MKIHVCIGILILLMSGCGAAQKGPAVEKREPRTLTGGVDSVDETKITTSDGGGASNKAITDETVVHGHISLPSALLVTGGSVAPTRVFVDGNDEISTLSDANGDFRLVVPALFSANFKDSVEHRGIGLVATVAVDGASHGVRQQLETFKKEAATDAGTLELQPFVVFRGLVKRRRDGSTENADRDALVAIPGSGFTAVPGDDGIFRLLIPFGDWKLQVSQPGFKTQQGWVKVAVPVQQIKSTDQSGGYAGTSPPPPSGESGVGGKSQTSAPGSAIGGGIDELPSEPNPDPAVEEDPNPPALIEFILDEASSLP